MNAYSNISPFILLSLLLLLSCSKVPTAFERDNPNDPDNPTFEIPSPLNFQTQILSDRKIQLVWEDTINYITGYIVEKSLNGESFLPLDTLESSIRSYIDESGNVLQTTRYSLTAFRVGSDGKRKSSDSKFVYIDFGTIINSNVSYNSDTTAINFNWDFQNLWPFVSVVYDDSLTPIDTLFSGANSYTTPAFEKDFSEFTYTIKSYSSIEEASANNPIGQIEGGYFGNMEFLPQITDVTVIDEGTVVINWNDNSSFEDGFQILRSKGFNRITAGEPEVIATLEPNQTSYIDTLNPLDGYQNNSFDGQSLSKTYYGIRATKNDTQTGIFGEEIFIDLPTPELELINSDKNSIILAWPNAQSWSAKEKSLAKNFVLQRQVDKGIFQDYKILPKSIFEYRIDDLDPVLQYSFRVKTLTSKHSNLISASYFNKLVEEQFYELPSAHHIDFSNSGKLFTTTKRYSSSSADWGMKIIDSQGGTILYSKNKNGITGSDIAENLNWVGYFSLDENFIYNYIIFDFKTDTLVREIKNPFNGYTNYPVSKFSPSEDSFFILGGRSYIKGITIQDFAEIFFNPSSGPTSTPRELDLSATSDTIAYNISDTFQLINNTGKSLSFTPTLGFGRLSHSVRISPLGNYIGLVSDFDNCIIFDLKSKQEVFRDLRAETISFSFDEKYFSTSKFNVLKIHDLQSKVHKTSIFFNSEIVEVKFSPSENILLVATSQEGIFQFSISDEKSWGRF